MKKGAVIKLIIELGVIIMGVLIALLAENEWSDFKDRTQGREYIVRLVEEAEAQSASSEADRFLASQACASGHAILGHLNGTDPIPDPAAILRHAVITAAYSSYQYQRSTYDDLVSTGGLGLIGDATLRERIIRNYNELDGLISFRPLRQDPYRSAVLRVLPPEYVREVLSDCVRDPETWRMREGSGACETVPSGDSPELFFQRLRARPEFQELLSERTYVMCSFSSQVEIWEVGHDSLASELDRALR